MYASMEAGSMKALNIVRKIDSVGRISIPAKLRSVHNININDYMELYQEGTCIILKKYIPKCVFCGGTDTVKTYKTKFVCHECASILKK